ncbi:hypothetical protein AG1IA_01274 [Rhizoctonia solani AG-1 IA]|uniref:Uncharacterized protein n=1 Tax=Thanatephorus cucumeris (strain AG1-IA) TaxID=983506 RepID=L8X3B9_THACA|nr:hypothetical protein AG1IA_01274 [Rhizoctonia solani AG-1 IA]
MPLNDPNSGELRGPISTEKFPRREAISGDECATPVATIGAMGCATTVKMRLLLGATKGEEAMTSRFTWVDGWINGEVKPKVLERRGAGLAVVHCAAFIPGGTAIKSKPVIKLMP